MVHRMNSIICVHVITASDLSRALKYLILGLSSYPDWTKFPRNHSKFISSIFKSPLFRFNIFQHCNHFWECLHWEHKPGNSNFEQQFSSYHSISVWLLWKFSSVTDCSPQQPDVPGLNLSVQLGLPLIGGQSFGWEPSLKHVIKSPKSLPFESWI